MYIQNQLEQTYNTVFTLRLSDKSILLCSGQWHRLIDFSNNRTSVCADNSISFMLENSLVDPNVL